MQQTLDPLWVAEFCGFFWGEGNFMIDLYERTLHRTKKLSDGTIKDYGYHTTFTARVRVRIIQRDDDSAVLEMLRDVLGGHIYVHKSHRMVSGANGKYYTNHRQLVWQVQDRQQVKRILDLLDTGTFPAKKRREIEIMRQAIAIMDSKGHRYSQEDRERLRALKAELSRLRQYDGS